MFKQAFNALTRLHGRDAYLKRLGTPTIYSPIRITPSNYFRFLEGPSSTVIKGREFIIPVDSMKGHPLETVTFDAVPTLGTFQFVYDGNFSSAIAFDASATAVRTAVRVIPGLEAVTVTGDFATGFVFTMVGVQEPLLFQWSPDADFDAVMEGASLTGYTPWDTLIKRADKIIDSTLGNLAIDEIIEIVDLGGSIMGYRCRCE